MLLTAYGMFIARNPKAKLDLVLAGTFEKYEINVFILSDWKGRISWQLCGKAVHF